MKELLLSPWGIASFVVAAGLFGVYFWFCAKKIFALSKDIEKILASSDVAAAFEESKLLASAWRNFKAALVNKKYSTADAAEFFNLQNLTRGMNMNFWQAYGGIFTGLGILGTFAGLTFGLSGVDMTSNDIEPLKKGIAQLLSGVELAFVTSLVGIACAIVYSFIHHALLVGFQKNIQSLAEKLDEKFPRRSVEDWLADNHSESQNQTAELKNIDTGISDQKVILQNIGEQVAEAIYDGLDEKLGVYVEKICAAIEKLGTGGAKAVEEIFTSQVGSQMDRFSAALDRFSDSIDDKLKNADEISKIMNEQLLKMLQELNESLKQQAATSAAEREKANQEFLSALQSLTTALNDLTNKNKTQQENSVKEFETLLKNSLDNFNAVMKQLLSDTQADRTADDNKRKNDAAQNQAANKQFLATLAGLSQTLQDVADKIAKQQGNSLNNFDTLIQNLVGKLEQFTEQQNNFLKTVATSNAVQISGAVAAFKEVVDAHNATIKKMFEQVQNQLKETKTFLQQVNTVGTSIKQIADPVRRSAIQLENRLSETNRAAEDFRREITTQMTKLGNTNQSTAQNIADLSAKLKDFTDKFNGIADELEKSTDVIRNSLENYNSKMNEGMSKNLHDFDKRISDAVSYFRELVEDLSDALDHFNGKRR